MNWESFFCLGIITLVLAGLIANRAPDVLLLGGVVLMLVAGIISPEDAFAGFANTGMLTVAALYIVAAALRETGALEVIGRWVLGRAKSERQALTRMSVWVTTLSAFLNNTPIVAMFMPVLVNWSKKHQVAPSKLLLPLSYLTILGGTCTLIGTSTNLVVNGLMEQTSKSQAALAESLRPMGLFEMSWVGVPYAIVGIVYLLTVGHRLLPSRKDFLEVVTGAAREYLVNLKVQQGCRLIGQNVQAAGLRQLPGLFLVEIGREDRVISPVTPDQVLRANDVLTFTGVVGTIVDLERIPGLVPVADEQYEAEAVKRRYSVLCEAVVSRTSPCIGKTIRDANFRARYNAAVVAVHRGEERLQGKVGDLVLRSGDTLLLQTGSHFVRVNRNSRDFFLVSGIEDSRPLRHDKTIISLVLLGLLIVLMATGIVSTVTAAFLVAGLAIVTRCISATDARQNMDWQTLITIAAAFGLGTGCVKSGLVNAIAEFVVNTAGQWGPYAVFASVYLMTCVFTELLSNNAAAALVFPFAVAIAQHLQVNPRPFAMAVAFAASASFITPIGYQTNMMVYGPGGYRLSDFVRIGLPLSLLLQICANLLIPRVWPL